MNPAGVAWGNILSAPTIPTQVSQLTNDSNYLTLGTLPPHLNTSFVSTIQDGFSAANLYRLQYSLRNPITGSSGSAAIILPRANATQSGAMYKEDYNRLWSDTYNKTEVNSLVNAVNTAEFQGPYATTALIPTPYDTNDLYLVGTTAPYDVYILHPGGDPTDVSDLMVIGTTSVDLTNYYNKAEVDALLALKVAASDLATVAFSGDYWDLINRPFLTGYGTSLSVQADAYNFNLALMKRDPVTGSTSADTTPFPLASSTTRGIMSVEDKVKLDSLTGDIPTLQQVINAGSSVTGNYAITMSNAESSQTTSRSFAGYSATSVISEVQRDLLVNTYEVVLRYMGTSSTGFNNDGNHYARGRLIYSPNNGFAVHNGQPVLDADPTHTITPANASVFRTKVETTNVPTGTTLPPLDSNTSLVKFLAPNSVVLNINGLPKPQTTVLIKNTAAGNISVQLPTVITGAAEVVNFDGTPIIVPPSKWVEVSLLTVDDSVFIHAKVAT